MGLGGILASMAQGFGGSMVKIADEAWKKEAEDRKFKFYADESEKDRVHKSDEAEKQRAWDKEKIGIEHANQVALENIKGRNQLAAIAAQARQSGRSEPSEDAVFMADSNNALTMIRKQLDGDGENQGLYAQRNATSDPTLKEKLNAQIAYYENKAKAIVSGARFNQIMNGKTAGETVSFMAEEYARRYNPDAYKPRAEPVPAKAVDKPTVAPPQSSTETPNKYVVDISDPAALKRAQDALAKERQKKVKESLTPYNSAPTQYGNLGVTGFSLY